MAPREGGSGKYPIGEPAHNFARPVRLTMPSRPGSREILREPIGRARSLADLG